MEEDPLCGSHDPYEDTLYDSNSIYQELDRLLKSSEPSSFDDSSGNISRLPGSKLKEDVVDIDWVDDFSQSSHSKLNDEVDDWIDDLTMPKNPQSDVEVPKKSRHSCAGLMNLGNTCFLNSVLQCLFYTAPFAKYVKNGAHKASCQLKGFCTMCAVEDLLNAVHSSPGRTVSPCYLADNLFKTSNLFVKGQQQDAHEFLFLLLEGLQNCCTSRDPEKNPSAVKDNSFVSDIFIGQLRSEVKCDSCLHSSYSSEASLGLSLEVENCSSIVEALSRFTAVEALEEDKKALCEHCKNHASRSKQLTFNKPPQVLAIHLKRFRASELSPTKIGRSIDYELTLDLTPFKSRTNNKESDQEGDLKYTLYAVLVHSGWSTASGHYFCFVHTSPGTWHRMSDNLVSEVNERTVLAQEAYILFYIRGGMEVCSFIANNASNSSLEPVSISWGKSCIKCTLPENAHTSSECDTNLTSVSRVTPTIPRQMEGKDICTCSQVKVSPSEAKLNCSSKQLDLDGVPNIFSTTKMASNKQTRPHDDEQMCGRPDQSKKSQCYSGDQSRSEAKHTISPAHLKGGDQAVPDSFQNGTQQSYMRLLSAMPANRRQALLASAFPGQQANKQSSLAGNGLVAAEKASILKKTKRPQDEEPQKISKQHLDNVLIDGKRRIFSDKPWIQDYSSDIGIRKLQRVAGGKRVVASLVHADLLHGCAKNCHESGLSQVDRSKQ